jgi:hypothetical protein
MNISCFFQALGSEFRTSRLLGRHSTTWATLLAPIYCFVLFFFKVIQHKLNKKNFNSIWKIISIANLLLFGLNKDVTESRAPLAHAYNPSYLGSRDQVGHSLRPSWVNSSQDPISKIPNTKKRHAPELNLYHYYNVIP